MSGTPPLSTYVRNQVEQRERQWQTSFPAKVLEWNADGTVQLEPQFIEVWRDGEVRQTETIEAPEDAYIDNVPVLYPRSGDWSITFPIVTGSFGLVTCTKYSLDVWRNQGNAVDPGDLRRFTMSGAVFHPVNLHPNSSALSKAGSDMVIGDGSQTSQFVALANLVNSELSKIKTELEDHEHNYIACSGGTSGLNPATPTTGNDASYARSDVDSATVKVSE